MAYCGLSFYKSVVIAHFTLLIVGCASSKPADNQPDGKALYAAYCVSCHGADGRNDRSGAVPTMRLNTTNAISPAEWRHLVTTGRRQMPAFQNRLTPAHLDALRAYVRQLTAQP